MHREVTIFKGEVKKKTFWGQMFNKRFWDH